jgi:rod shape-determining protein MreD
MRTLLVLALALVLEAIRLSLFARFPAHPDFLLGLVVLIALARKPPAGAAAGFALGVLRDLIYGNVIGVEALPMSLVGWLAGSFSRSVYHDSPFTQATFLFLAGLAKSALSLVLLGGGELTAFPRYMLLIGFPSALLTALAVPLARLGIERLLHVRLRLHAPKTLIKR